jgi:hypothetical protein
MLENANFFWSQLPGMFSLLFNYTNLKLEKYLLDNIMIMLVDFGNKIYVVESCLSRFVNIGVQFWVYKFTESRYSSVGE